MEDVIEQEVQLLEAMFPEELTILKRTQGGEWVMEITIRPKTELESQSHIYAFVTLTISVPPEYPKQAPKISVRKMRGINQHGADDLLSKLRESSSHRQNSNSEPFLFDVIEQAREEMTVNNRPHGECAICLCVFDENGHENMDWFVKTDCYHYFHDECFKSYRNCQNSGDLLCPVCRSPL
eukprot:TRINITY_DN3164_c0_g1_i1.p1 TRINITY_DN3164_c0_g1~~TRINITY_DN3164_c0_g1_i1.p1  ORF type:complete len:181 (-),score=39.37 TRINITY_DN3164_c0_g1_i1:81-623(-)